MANIKKGFTLADLAEAEDKRKKAIADYNLILNNLQGERAASEAALLEAKRNQKLEDVFSESKRLADFEQRLKAVSDLIEFTGANAFYSDAQVIEAANAEAARRLGNIYKLLSQYRKLEEQLCGTAWSLIVDFEEISDAQSAALRYHSVWKTHYDASARERTWSEQGLKGLPALPDLRLIQGLLNKRFGQSALGMITISMGNPIPKFGKGGN